MYRSIRIGQMNSIIFRSFDNELTTKIKHQISIFQLDKAFSWMGQIKSYLAWRYCSLLYLGFTPPDTFLRLSNNSWCFLLLLGSNWKFNKWLMFCFFEPDLKTEPTSNSSSFITLEAPPGCCLEGTSWRCWWFVWGCWCLGYRCFFPFCFLIDSGLDG